MGGNNILVRILGALLVCVAAKATVPDSSRNPYQGIVERNVFGLKPAPPDSKPLPPPPPALKIVLSGITTILPRPLALLKVQMPARPSEPAREESYILTEGQRDGEIEVIEINAEAGSVKVRNSGIVSVLTLDKDGAKPAATPPPASPLAVVPTNPIGYSAPALTPSPALSSAPGAPSTGLKAIPIRNVRMPVPTAGPADSAAAPAQPQPVVQPQSAAQLSPEEEQAIMAELERERARQQTNNGQLPPQAPVPLR